jgi:hypothetical protein
LNRLFKLSIAGCALAAALLFSGSALAFQDPAAKNTKSTTKTTKAAPASAPSDKDIADAQAKGLVWVNLNTKVYHKGGQFYGKTVHGKFMTEADAQKAGYHAAKEPVSKQKPAATNK